MEIDYARFMADTKFIWGDFVKGRRLDAAAIDDYAEIVDREKIVSRPDVSIVILTYNHGEMLNECVKSVLCQETKYSFEIIIANDNSSDASSEKICHDLQRNNPGVIRLLQAKSNVGSIRNAVRGIRECRGRFIACIDGDDFYLSRAKIEIQVSYLRANPNVSACFCSFYQQLNNHNFWRVPIRRKTKREYESLNNLSGEERANLILRRNRLAPICAFFRLDSAQFAVERITQLFKIIDWFPCQDFELWYYMAFTGPIHFIPQELCVYRTNYTSASNDNRSWVACARMFGDTCNKLAMLQDAPPFITKESIHLVEKNVVYWAMRYALITRKTGMVSEYLQGLAKHFEISVKMENVSKMWISKMRSSLVGYIFRKIVLKFI